MKRLSVNSVWRIEYDPDARKFLKHADRVVAQRITRYLEERLAVAVDPRTLGATLTGPILGAYWKYRVGDYRIICDIQDETITILVVKIGNRREVYR